MLLLSCKAVVRWHRAFRNTEAKGSERRLHFIGNFATNVAAKPAAGSAARLAQRGLLQEENMRSWDITWSSRAEKKRKSWELGGCVEENTCFLYVFFFFCTEGRKWQGLSRHYLVYWPSRTSRYAQLSRSAFSLRLFYISLSERTNCFIIKSDHEHLKAFYSLFLMYRKDNMKIAGRKYSPKLHKGKGGAVS